MDFDEYQEESRKNAIYPSQGSNYIYPTLGLAGETGEVVEKVKKLIRDETHLNVKEISSDKKEEIGKEMGDVLWYLAQLATELDLSLSKVAKQNLEKITERKNRGVLHGEGDNR